MKNNTILFVIFFVVLFLLNSLFIMRPFFHEVGGCQDTSIFPCLVSIDLLSLFLSYTVFDFLIFTVIFYIVTIFLYFFTRSITTNKFYKHMLVFVLIKIILFTILFFRSYLPISFIYLFVVSFMIFYFLEVKLAYNELMIGDSRGRSWMTLLPSAIVGIFKTSIFYIIYPMGLVIVTWQMQ